MLSTIPCSGFLYLQFLARCHPYILFDFYTCFTHFSLTVSISRVAQSSVGMGGYLPGYPDIARAILLYARALDISAKIRMREIQLVTREMASHIAETSGSLKVAF